MEMAARTAQRLKDERGQAMLEGILAVMVLFGVLFACFFLLSYGIGSQKANMGSRVLAFGAGDANFAWPSKPANAQRGPGDSPTNTDEWGNGFSGGGDFVGTILSWLNDEQSGTVKDRVETRFLVDLTRYAPGSSGFYSTYYVASDPWRISTTPVNAAFLGIAWLIGLTQTGLDELFGTGGGAGGGGEEGGEWVEGKF
jgi:hypothetical protein